MNEVQQQGAEIRELKAQIAELNELKAAMRAALGDTHSKLVAQR